MVKRYTFSLILLLAAMGIGHTAAAQQYNQSVANQCIAFLGDTIVMAFPNTASPATAGSLTLYFFGDLSGTGSNLESFNIYSENGALLANTPSTAECGSTDSFTLTIAIDSLLDWTADNTIIFRAVPTSNVGPTVCGSPGTCIGGKLQYTYTTVPNDVRVSALVSPVNYCPGSQPVLVEVSNTGINQVNSLTVHWTFDGVLQTSVPFSGLLDTIGGSGNFSAQVVLGVKNFAAGVRHDIVAWTSQPNGQPDGNKDNDTLTVLGTQPSLTGTFTIGGTSPDYTTIQGAIDDLVKFGICGPVNFRLRPGTYREQIEIPSINGVSNTNTITFEAENGDSSSVVIVDAHDFSDNYTVLFRGGSHIDFRHLTFAADSITFYGKVIDLDGGSSHITFANCAFYGDTSGSTSSNLTLIDSDHGGRENHVVFSNCLLKGGSYAFNLGTTSTSETGWTIEHCKIYPYYRGIFIDQINRVTLKNNIIRSNTFANYSNFSGIYLSSCDSLIEVTANEINSEEGVYGMYLNDVANASGQSSLIANNMIHVGGTGSEYGLYLTGSTSFHRIYNNSVHVSEGGSFSRALYVASSSVNNILLFNNILVNGGSGYALYTSTSTPFANSNFNCYYTDQGTLVYWNGSTANDVPGLQSLSGFDANSLEVDPGFYSQTNLHVYSGLLNDKGIPFPEVPTDIDGQSRSILTPDIGADEFDPLQNDLTVIGFASPSQNGCDATDSTIVTVMIANNGMQPQSVFDVSLRIFAIHVTTETVNQTILPGDTLFYSFNTKVNLSVPSLYPLRAWVDLNGDQLPFNDTIGPYFLNVNKLIDKFAYVVPFDNTFAGIPVGWSNDNQDAGEEWFFEQSASNIPGDHTTGSGYFAYVDNSSPNSDATNLISPCMDVSSMVRPTLEFWLQNGSSSMLLHIDVLSDGQWIQDVVNPLGNQGGIWTFQRVDLTPYIGTSEIIKVRFRAQEIGTSSVSDLGIDDIKVYNLPPINTAVLSATKPNSGCGLSDVETIEVIAHHVGYDTLRPGDQVPMGFQVNNGPVFTETAVMTNTIAPGDSFTYEFFNIADLSTPGTYNIKVWTDHPLDDDFSNDTLRLEVVHIPIVANFPYQEDFEQGRGGWTTDGQNNSWAYGQPANETINTSINGQRAWATGNLTGDYNEDEQSYVQGPCFDFSTLFRPQVNLDIWWECYSGSDGAALLYSTDGGNTWQAAGAQGDGINWYNNTSISANPGGQGQGWSGTGSSGSQFWVNAKLNLPQLAGQPNVLFRVAFASNSFSETDGVAFDNFVVGNAPVINLPDTVRSCGFAKLDAGVPGLTYQWSDGSTQRTTTVVASSTTTTQTISLYVENSLGLYAQDEVVVVLEPGPYVDLGEDGTVCGEDSVILNAGNAGAQFQWNTGATSQQINVSQDGTYHVSVTSNGCTDVDTIIVDLEPIPDANFNYGTTPQGNNVVGFTNQSSGATSYTWWFGDGYFSTQQSPTHFYDNPGTYEVMLIATNNCGSDTSTQTITIYPVGVSQPGQNFAYQLFPNPTNGSAVLSIEQAQVNTEATIAIFDLQGRLVWQRAIIIGQGQQQVTLPSQDWPQGVYQVRIQHKKGAWSRTLIKQ